MGEGQINTQALGPPMHQYENKERVSAIQNSYVRQVCQRRTGFLKQFHWIVVFEGVQAWG